ncbi:MAG TPA: hypothetical protein VHF22_06895 [Planctomycetota bacterium]|nr:hypothetical protein [Planctomycetota bacterium]
MISSLVLVLGLVAAGAARADDSTAAPKTGETYPYDWGVAYYMSYDNNLEGCGQIIIDAIKSGVVGERTVAAVQADFTDAGGMHRYTIAPGACSETRTASDDSASEEEAAKYFRWFVDTYKCRKYVFTFLDHGGRIDEMCYDENPGRRGRQWMSGRIMGEKLRALSKDMGGRFELLFLQQCGRGSVENLYAFRGTASFVMSSPVPVGAPNTYYTALHKWLGEHPQATGDQIADEIATEDQDYTIYTCARGSKLAELPAKLDAAIAPFLGKKALATPERPPVIHPVGEPIVDLRTYLDRLASANGGEAKPVEALEAWAKKDLFTMVRFRNPRSRAAKQLCGLSIFAAGTPEEARRYEKLELYSASKLPQLWKKLLADAKEAEKAKREKTAGNF